MNLKTKRKELKMSQTDVAIAVGITQTAYSNYELGKRQPKPKMLKNIATVLNCTVDELIGDDDDRIGETGA